MLKAEKAGPFLTLPFFNVKSVVIYFLAIFLNATRPRTQIQIGDGWRGLEGIDNFLPEK